MNPLSQASVRHALGSEQVFREPTSAAVRLVPGAGWSIIQVLADFASLFAAGMLTYGLYLFSGFGRRHYDPALYSQLNLTFAVVTLFALMGFGAYRSQVGLLRIESVRTIIEGVAAGLALALGLSFLLQFPPFSRLTMLMLGPIMVAFLVTERFFLWKLQDRMRSMEGYARPVLVYGAGETGRLMAQHLLGEHALGLKPVGFLDDDERRLGQLVRVGAGVEGARIRVLGTEDDLESVFEGTQATAVFIAMPSATSERIAQIVSRLETLGKRCFFVPSAGDLLFSGLQFGQIAGMPIFTRRTESGSRLYEICKRGVDVSFATVALLVSLPVLALAAVLLKLTAPGPVMFTQTRCGLRGKPFTIYKLRTMRTDAPRYAPHPNSADDDRVTPIGRWLRRSSIDELPQLWNVLRGDMSLVGPRPEMPGLVEEYNDIQRQRLAVKPGLTGMWQISADRAFRIHDNIHYDLYYIENRSVALDLAVLVVTPFVLLAKNRAM